MALLVVFGDTGGSLMKIIKYAVVLLLCLPAPGQADALFGSDLAGDRKLPKTFGIGVDYFSLDQPFQIDRLSISTPDSIGCDRKSVNERSAADVGDLEPGIQYPTGC